MIRYTLLLVLPISAFFSCTNPSPNVEVIQKEILDLEKAQRAFHVEKDASGFVTLFSDDFVSISNGVISFPDTSSMFKRFDAYFNRVEFIAWDDVSDPIIRISDDGSMAYSILNKIVIVKYPNEDSVLVTDTTRFAWTTLYRKEKGEWKIDAVTSTNQ